MIGRISGTIDHVAADHVLIDTGGVGYIVHCSERTLAGLPGPGGTAALYTELLVREDLMQLYGFATLAERDFHRLLTSVQGVGARVALAIIGALGTEQAARALALGDAAAMRVAPGVGPKLAQRIVTELKDKAPALMGREDAVAPSPAPTRSGGGGGSRQAAPARQPASDQSATADALSALSHLGYAPAEAAQAVAAASSEAPDADTPALIRRALQLLAPRG
ncbi:MAG: Holliday junction branch migration protein RuvA [Alphaproteobacteria bacterium]|nr:MAG: Holliday junction branch migration protein RuvA [Alphaproteobacteria bacterium]